MVVIVHPKLKNKGCEIIRLVNQNIEKFKGISNIEIKQTLLLPIDRLLAIPKKDFYWQETYFKKNN
jgi:hypothetical protein